MNRDTLSEIAAVRRRAAGSSQRHAFIIDQFSSDYDDGVFNKAKDFVVIRLVTIIEVCFRWWTAQIIDHGDPFTQRAATLVKNGVKIDYAVAQALAGKTVSLGDLISHSVSINNAGDLARVFGTLLDHDFWRLLQNVSNRWEVEILGRAPKAIIEDVRLLQKQLTDLFETRHILVHELPENFIIETDKLDSWVRSVNELISASDELFHTSLYGSYPLTQDDINIAAHRAADDADIELAEAIIQMGPISPDKTFDAAQEAWTRYRDLHCRYASGIGKSGSGTFASMLYSDEYARITKLRTDEILTKLDQELFDI